MTTLQSRKHSWLRIGLFQFASVFVHLALLIGLVLPFAANLLANKPLPVEPPKPNPEFKLSVVEEPRKPKEKVIIPPTPMPKVAPEKIVQKTNEVAPEKANFVSKNANRVEKDERAELTQENPIERQENPTQPSELEKTSSASESTDNKPVDIQKLFNVPMAAMESPLGRREQAARAALTAKDANKKVLADFDARDKAFRGALESFASEVAVGNHTGVNAYSDSAKFYLERIHQKIHRRWADGYLPYLDSSVPMGSPLRNPNLNTKLEMVIDGATGVVEKVSIVNTSGELMYDSEAIIIAQTIGPHGLAPDDATSPNGKVYIHWNFWRDSRQCGIFGAEMFIVNKDG
jgi:outer membrane biosynthesis protein TonB